MIKASKKSLGGTSYYGENVVATLAKIEKVIGKSGEGDGYTVSHEWTMELEDGRVFSVYDWKEGRIGRRKIEWHIGALDKQTTIDAQNELMKLLNERS